MTGLPGGRERTSLIWDELEPIRRLEQGLLLRTHLQDEHNAASCGADRIPLGTLIGDFQTVLRSAMIGEGFWHSHPHDKFHRLLLRFLATVQTWYESWHLFYAVPDPAFPAAKAAAPHQLPEFWTLQWARALLPARDPAARAAGEHVIYLAVHLPPDRALEENLRLLGEEVRRDLNGRNAAHHPKVWLWKVGMRGMGREQVLAGASDRSSRNRVPLQGLYELALLSPFRTKTETLARERALIAWLDQHGGPEFGHGQWGRTLWSVRPWMARMGSGYQ